MSGRKRILVTFGFVLSVALFASALTGLLLSGHYSKTQYDTLNSICEELVQQEPEAKRAVLTALKAYTAGESGGATKNGVLSEWGYCASDFQDSSCGRIALFTALGLLAGIFLFAAVFLCRNRMEAMRIQALTEYLERVNTGEAAVLSAAGEDDFSKLADEIYKTVTFLYQTRDAAVQARDDFAENLSNIAHQIKTPITAISLSLQAMQEEYGKEEPGKGREEYCEGERGQIQKELGEERLGQIRRQLIRLTRLEEALLVLSRLDAGTLVLQRNETDVFTILVLAADNLQELFAGSGTSIDIPELGEMAITADLDWTMEAVMNLMKNCMEHHEGGVVHCSYGQNPLYTEILIWDEGEGFAKEDIPRLFERFYRGQNAHEGGIGIGLALAKEIIERQNGTIRAKNMTDGGACFEIRFYCH